MKREIKFRAWDNADVYVYSNSTDPKRMSFYGSDFTMDDNQNTISFITPEGKRTPYGDHDSMKRYTLMQFTGFKDENGKEIYEFDWVKIRYAELDPSSLEIPNQKNEEIIPVKWVNGGFNIGRGILNNEEYEVVGNMFEQPNLLDDNSKGDIIER